VPSAHTLPNAACVPSASGWSAAGSTRTLMSSSSSIPQAPRRLSRMRLPMTSAPTRPREVYAGCCSCPTLPWIRVAPASGSSLGPALHALAPQRAKPQPRHPLVVRQHPGSPERRYGATRQERSRRLTRSSFTHLIHLYLTQNDDLQLEAANRPVPCKYKGIRGFSETFGND
jgi:hypothetical protein